MNKYLLLFSFLAWAITAHAQEVYTAQEAKPPLGVMITGNIGGYTAKTNSSMYPYHEWEQQSNLRFNLAASKSVAKNLYIGAGLGYALDVIKSLPGKAVPCINCGYQFSYVKADYKINQRSIAPMLFIEYLFPVLPNLYLGVSSFDRLIFSKVDASSRNVATRYYRDYGGIPSGDSTASGDNQWKLFEGSTTVSSSTQESKVIAINSGLVTSIRWTFSKYIGLQLSTGGVQFTKELKSSRYSKDQGEKGWSLEANFEPKNWMLGVYAHF